MGGSSIRSARDHNYLFSYFVTILIIIQLISYCDAYFYSEKKGGSGNGDDKNCFCEVNICTLISFVSSGIYIRTCLIIQKLFFYKTATGLSR